MGGVVCLLLRQHDKTLASAAWQQFGFAYFMLRRSNLPWLQESEVFHALNHQIALFRWPHLA